MWICCRTELTEGEGPKAMPEEIHCRIPLDRDMPIWRAIPARHRSHVVPAGRPTDFC